MSIRHGKRLLGHLVERRGEFLLQGEVYSTIGLGWVLRASEGSRQFADLLGCSGNISWQAEVPVPQLGRIDILGQCLVGLEARPLCVVEAKIHERLDAGQLLAYAGWQKPQLERTGAKLAEAALGVLVPASRRQEADTFSDQFRAKTEVRIQVVTWEETFAVLEAADLPKDARCDLEQLEDLYHQYDASWISPFTQRQTTADGWAERSADYVKLTEQLAARLQRSIVGRPIPRLLPMLYEPEGEGTRRFIDLALPTITSVAFGIFRELDGVPFAIRYREADVPQFADLVKPRLETLRIELGRTGYVYIRLRVPTGVAQSLILADLERQALEVLRVAHPELPKNPLG